MKPMVEPYFFSLLHCIIWTISFVCAASFVSAALRCGRLFLWRQVSLVAIRRSAKFEIKLSERKGSVDWNRPIHNMWRFERIFLSRLLAEALSNVSNRHANIHLPKLLTRTLIQGYKLFDSSLSLRNERGSQGISPKETHGWQFLYSNLHPNSVVRAIRRNTDP